MIQDIDNNNETTSHNDDVSSYYYLCPNEGMVNPCEVVDMMQKNAIQNGISFIQDSTVTNVQPKSNDTDERTQQPQYNYCITYRNHHSANNNTSTIDADMVVIAGGDTLVVESDKTIELRFAY